MSAGFPGCLPSLGLVSQQNTMRGTRLSASGRFRDMFLLEAQAIEELLIGWSISQRLSDLAGSSKCILRHFFYPFTSPRGPTWLDRVVGGSRQAFASRRWRGQDWRVCTPTNIGVFTSVCGVVHTAYAPAKGPMMAQ